MSKHIAIIGDRFMLPEIFQEEFEKACGRGHKVRCMANGWPDENLEHGYATPGMDGLKEYLGHPDEVCEFVGDAEILINHLAPVPASVFERLPKLRMIAVSRGGPVNIDMQAAHKHDVLIVNCPVHEMTVGLIGYGQIGTRVVQLLKPFGPEILVTDPYVALSIEDADSGGRQVELDELLTLSDVVSLHPRVSPETEHMINAETLGRMKPGAVLVNTARGPLVDYPALEQAIVSEHLGGAMLETFGKEPPDKDYALLRHPNVTLTPHIAGASTFTIRKAARAAAEEVRRYIAGEAPINRC